MHWRDHGLGTKYFQWSRRENATSIQFTVLLPAPLCGDPNYWYAASPALIFGY